MSTFDDALQDAENSVRSGWDDTNEGWSPHGSLEGGRATLAYGHKLTDTEASTGILNLGGRPASIHGLSEAHAQLLYQQDKSDATAKAKLDWPGYANLPQKYKDVLTNIVFNTGNVQVHKWPKLRKHMLANNDKGVRKEMVTSYTDINGITQPLKNRATIIADAAGVT